MFENTTVLHSELEYNQIPFVDAIETKGKQNNDIFINYISESIMPTPFQKYTYTSLCKNKTIS